MTIHDRIMAKTTIDAATWCWNWRGSAKIGKYGEVAGEVRIVRDGKSIVRFAHRLLYEMEHGDIPAGRFLVRSCNNAYCINPDHMTLSHARKHIRPRVPVTHLTCKDCGETKPATAFFIDKTVVSGRTAKCRACHGKDTRKWKEEHADFERQRSLEWARENRHKRLAHKAVYEALRKGLISKQPCAVCGIADVEAHHANYSKPLDVAWLCRPHHALQHRKYDRVEAA